MILPKAHTDSVKEFLGGEYTAWENSFSAEPPVSIRVNPLKWKNNYPGTQIPWCETGRYLPQRPSFTKDPFFHAGYYYVQEASSMGIGQAFNQVVDLSKDLKVLDLCAAPGGKSTHILSLITENSLLVSNEVIRSRANILVENLVKWGRDNFIVTNNDPEQIGELTEFFDVMLADVPCSGEGLFRRDHDAIKEWSTAAVELCSLRQRRIILDAWSALKENGFLIYSTCTFNEEENEKNLLWLKDKMKFESVELQFPADWGIMETKRNGIHGYRFFPHRLKGEGFFMTVLQKKEHSSSKPGKQKPVMALLNNREKELVKNYVNDPARFDFYSFDGLVTLFRRTISADMQTVCRRLNVVHAGLAIAELQKGLKAVHPLAVSVDLNRKNFPEVALSKEDALNYLAKEEVKITGEKTGMTLVTYNGAPLGWVNALGNRANNLYPKEWRIRNR